MAVNLYTFLSTVAPSLHTDAATLWAYASQDEGIGGVDTGWITGSMWEVEGKALYAIVRALKPTRMLEIGTRYGCSTTHILAAMAANGHGELVSLDIVPFAGNIAPELRQRWTFVQTDAMEWVTANREPFDVVWEDGDHAYIWTRDMMRLIRDNIDPPFTISHDAAHPLVGNYIRQAWDEVYGRRQYKVALIDVADCGFAYRFKGE